MAPDTRNRRIRAAVGVGLVAALVLGLAAWRPSNLYPWLKAFHVIAVMSWMAGMLYLPRLFVYHCDAEPGSRESETFKVMERRLVAGAVNTPLVVSLGFGGWMGLDWC